MKTAICSKKNGESVICMSWSLWKSRLRGPQNGFFREKYGSGAPRAFVKSAKRDVSRGCGQETPPLSQVKVSKKVMKTCRKEVYYNTKKR